MLKNIPFLKPQVALAFFVTVMVLYLIFLDKEGAFQEKFLRFGPAPDSKFLNITLDKWSKVITIYFIAFFSALSLSYYQNIASSFVNGVLLNPAYKDTVKQSRFLSSILVIVDPIITASMGVLSILVTLTQQLQFIFFQILGTLVVTIPSNLYNLSFKKFASA